MRQREHLVLTNRALLESPGTSPDTRSHSVLKPRAGSNKGWAALLYHHTAILQVLFLSFTQVSRKSWKSVTSFDNCLWSGTETWGLGMKFMGLTCQTSFGLSILPLTSLVLAAVQGDPDIPWTFSQFPVSSDTDGYLQSPLESSQWTSTLKVTA